MESNTSRFQDTKSGWDKRRNFEGVAEDFFGITASFSENQDFAVLANAALAACKDNSYSDDLVVPYACKVQSEDQKEETDRFLGEDKRNRGLQGEVAEAEYKNFFQENSNSSFDGPYTEIFPQPYVLCDLSCAQEQGQNFSS